MNPNASPKSTSPQFSLRTLFVVVTLSAILFGGVFGFLQAKRHALRNAVRSAYEEGHLPLENARERVGDEVYRWRMPKQP